MKRSVYYHIGGGNISVVGELKYALGYEAMIFGPREVSGADTFGVSIYLKWLHLPDFDKDRSYISNFSVEKELKSRRFGHLKRDKLFFKSLVQRLGKDLGSKPELKQVLLDLNFLAYIILVKKYVKLLLGFKPNLLDFVAGIYRRTMSVNVRFNVLLFFKNFCFHQEHARLLYNCTGVMKLLFGASHLTIDGKTEHVMMKRRLLSVSLEVFLMLYAHVNDSKNFKMRVFERDYRKFTGRSFSGNKFITMCSSRLVDKIKFPILEKEIYERNCAYLFIKIAVACCRENFPKYMPHFVTTRIIDNLVGYFESEYEQFFGSEDEARGRPDRSCYGVDSLSDIFLFFWFLSSERGDVDQFRKRASPVVNACCDVIRKTYDTFENENGCPHARFYTQAMPILTNLVLPMPNSDLKKAERTKMKRKLYARIKGLIARAFFRGITYPFGTERDRSTKISWARLMCELLPLKEFRADFLPKICQFVVKMFLDLNVENTEFTEYEIRFYRFMARFFMKDDIIFGLSKDVHKLIPKILALYTRVDEKGLRLYIVYMLKDFLRLVPGICRDFFFENSVEMAVLKGHLKENLEFDASESKDPREIALQPILTQMKLNSKIVLDVLDVLFEQNEYIVEVSPPEDIVRYCDFCGRENAKNRCSKCKKVFYCARKCQLKAWKVHKIDCGALSI